jgi:hypothetical protein
MVKNFHIKILCGFVIVLILISSGCIDTFDIDNTVIEGKYAGKNNVNESIIKITRVENSPDAHDVYALVRDVNGNNLEWHAYGDNPGEKHPISSVSAIDIWRTRYSDIEWNDIYEDDELRPDEEFFISIDLVPEDSSGYTFVLEYKTGKVLLEVAIE